MATLAEALQVVGAALLDPWYVVDSQDRIVQSNDAFRQWVKSDSAQCRSALGLSACDPAECVRATCQDKGPTQWLSVTAHKLGSQVRLNVHAIPVELPNQEKGALIVLRDVTDVVRLQEKYQSLLHDSEAQQLKCREQLDERTRQLLAANDELTRLEAELARALRERL